MKYDSGGFLLFMDDLMTDLIHAYLFLQHIHNTLKFVYNDIDGRYILYSYIAKLNGLICIAILSARCVIDANELAKPL